MSHEFRPRILNREIFQAALEITNPVQRKAYLDNACDGDAVRRAQIEHLLAAQEFQRTNPLDVAVHQLDLAEALSTEPLPSKRQELFAPL